MHAFDADLLQGDTIFIRPARAGEHFHALNDEDYTLDPSNLVIADAGGAIALAGVIGGADSAIGDTTTRVVLESANFNASSVRSTSSAIKLRTDASMRFEKAQDPANTVRGLARAIELLQRGLARHSHGGRPRRPEAGIAAALRRSICRWTGWSANWDAPSMPPRCATSWNAWSSAWPNRTPRRVLASPCPPGAPPKTSPSRTTWWKKSAAWWATIPSRPRAPAGPGRRAARQPRAQVPARSAQRVRGPGLHRGLQLLVPRARRPSAPSASIPADHVRVTNPIASDQALHAHVAAARHLEQRPRERQASRIASACSKSAWRFTSRRPRRCRDEMPHLVAAIYDRQGDGAAGLFEIKRAAECLMPGAEACPRRSTPLRASGARRRRLSGRDSRWAACSNCIPRWWRPGARPCWISTCTLVQRPQRRRRTVHAHPPLPFERVRSVGGRRPARARRQPAGRHRLVRRSAAGVRANSCASTPARRSKRASRASPSA